MNCLIYKGTRWPGTYLYVPDEDALEDVPEIVLKQMGELEHVMDLELTPDRKLARADASAVITSIRHQGFYLQMPPSETEPSMARYLKPVKND